MYLHQQTLAWTHRHTHIHTQCVRTNADGRLTRRTWLVSFNGGRWTVNVAKLRLNSSTSAYSPKHFFVDWEPLKRRFSIAVKLNRSIANFLFFRRSPIIATFVKYKMATNVIVRICKPPCLLHQPIQLNDIVLQNENRT